MTLIRLLASLAAGVILWPLAAQAHDWPNRPIGMVVPFGAGGSTDVAARVVGESLSRSLGQQVFVENKSGANNGTIGIEVVTKSPPAGYTILVAPDAVASNPHVFQVNH